MIGRSALLSMGVILGAVGSAGPLQAMEMVGVANVGPQWRVDALFTAPRYDALIGCQATDRIADDHAAMAITLTPDGAYHLSQGYDESPPQDERGAATLNLIGDDGSSLSGTQVNGAVGADRFALVIPPDQAQADALAQSVQLELRGAKGAHTKQLKSMAQLVRVLTACVSHYDKGEGHATPGSDADLVALGGKIAPLLGSEAKAVSRADWDITPGKGRACIARKRMADGAYWTLALDTDFVLMLASSVEPDAVLAGLRSDDDLILHFDGIKTVGGFGSSYEGAFVAKPTYYITGHSGADKAVTGFDADSFMMASFANAQAVRLVAKGREFRLALSNPKGLLADLAQCLRMKYGDEAAVPSIAPATFKALIADLLSVSQDKVRVGNYPFSLSAASSFRAENYTGHMTVFDATKRKAPKEQLDQYAQSYFSSCHAKYRDQSLSDEQASAGAGRILACDSRGHVNYQTVLIRIKDGLGYRLLIEAYSVPQNAKDMMTVFRRTSRRANRHLADFVAGQ